MKQLTIFLFAFIFIVKTTSGHVGGHYHSGDGTVFNSWTLKNGQHVLGNFMYSNGRQIFVEANEGKIIAILSDFGGIYVSTSGEACQAKDSCYIRKCFWRA